MSFNTAAALAAKGNGTEAASMNLTSLPSNILEAFIPGYSLLSRFILEAFGFDISLVVSIFALLFAVSTAANYSYRYLYSLSLTYLTASVTVDSQDDIYSQILSWVSEHLVTKNSRSLRAKSGWLSTWDDAEDGISSTAFEENCEPGGLVNFSNWEAKVPPRFEPHDRPEWFWHKGHYFCVKRAKTMLLNNQSGPSTFAEEETLTITVFGRSTQPIKQLIIEARDACLAREKCRTTVRRPGPRVTRYRGMYAWSKVATRPSRPIETVVLDEVQKKKVLLDINEYLHPATPQWYANRGIPYRRGYLFHGAPGTGKTSLSFAIAGVFGLDIYCISLLEPSLTEEDLGLLFNTLPRRCVVLLEDIDTAGLARQGGEIDSADGAGGNEKDTNGSGQGTGKATKKADKRKKARRLQASGTDMEESPGISLSGLLNAIDGVASHEGRVLVMTTNNPESLDDALIRPGRVDMQVEFALATREQIREIFIRMYSPETTSPALESAERELSDRLDAHAVSRHVTLRNRRSLTTSKNAENSALKNATVPSPPATPSPSDLSSFSENSCGDESGTSSAARTSATDVSYRIPQTNSYISNTKSMNSHNDPNDAIDDINHLAFKFAECIPENTFSPAEIQGFLLTRKGDPLRAFDEVESWRDETLVAREKTGNGAGSMETGNSSVGDGKTE